MKNAKVIVEKIYDAKEGKNPDFKTLQLRSTVENKSLLNIVLGSDGFKSSRVAFQSMHKDVIAKLGLEEGDDLSEKLKEAGIPDNLANVRIAHFEQTKEEIGFQALINPETKEPVTSGGKQVYFKISLIFTK